MPNLPPRYAPAGDFTRRATILITAGEASGDVLGAGLMAALRAQRADVKFIGVGGPEMQKQGLKPIFPMEDLAVMGVAEVVPAIPRILARIKELTALAVKSKPDLVITIDSQDFSARLAKALKPFAIPHIHYVAPKVWAWRRGRARKLANLYTHMLTVLPFEKDFFQSYGIPTTYVGHPALTHLAAYLRPLGQAPSTLPVLALLPGSRKSEIKRHWPLFLATYRRLKQQVPYLTAHLVLNDESALALCQSAANWSTEDSITPTVGPTRFTALKSCTAALAKSGTNNLEMALIGACAVVAYRTSLLTYLVARCLVKVPFISLPNIILNAPVYPEFIQNAANARTLAEHLQPLLTLHPQWMAQQQGLQTLRQAMATPHPPAIQAAAAILPFLPPQ